MVANVPESGKCVQHFLKPRRGDYGLTEYLPPWFVVGAQVLECWLVFAVTCVAKCVTVRNSA
jgi:hypothetical protein